VRQTTIKKNQKIERFISGSSLRKVLGILLKETRLIAPLKVSGEIVFGEAKSLGDIVFEYENCLNAPKDFIFLNDQALFRYNSKSKNRVSKDKDNRKQVIFGSRSCDSRASALLDKFFSKDNKDPLYFARRDNTLIISLMCDKLGRECFCTSTHSGPYLDDGFDIQLIPLGKGYILEASSGKGKDLLRRFSHLTKTLGSKERARREEIIKKAADSKPVEFDLKKVYHNLRALNKYAPLNCEGRSAEATPRDALWRDLAQRCQSCGGCLLICPTCSCFYLLDQKIDQKKGVKLRRLDACFYRGFTRLSGGYNPVASPEQMIKRKFHHKLCQQLDRFGEPGCTGCGRCNQICPGNVNWLETIKRIQKSR